MRNSDRIKHPKKPTSPRPVLPVSAWTMRYAVIENREKKGKDEDEKSGGE